MAKAARAVCERCEHRLHSGAPFCSKCGIPTAWASHDDRVAWELNQYREKAEKSPMGVLYEPSSVRTAVMDKPKSSRRPRLFGRKSSHGTTIVVPEAAPPAPAPPVLRAVEPLPVQELPEKPKARSVARPKPAKTDKEPLRDTPATMLAMRMLNARVAELDSTIQKMQHEIEMLRRG